MANRRLTEKYDSELLDYTKWPVVLIDNFKPEEKEVFINRKTAVEMYINGENHSLIYETTKIRRNEVNNYFEKCLSTDEFGQIYGYRALIPQIRTNKTTKQFGKLIEAYPQLDDLITKLLFRKNNKKPSEPLMRKKDIFKRVIQECIKLGLKSRGEYPFNTLGFGQRSFYNYIKKLEESNFEQASKRHGEESYLIATSTGVATNPRPIISRPYERVQFDGHRIDVDMALIHYTPEGDEIITRLDRIWLLTILELSTDCILGYHLSFEKEYTAGDVLQCIKKAIVPWKRKSFTIPGLKYLENSGLPSGIIENAEWALWDEIQYDKAKSNLSQIVRDRLKQIVNCRVNAGPIKSPISRNQVERLFGLLEENGFHRTPSTTGSNPKDPRGKDSEISAVKYRITAEHMEELTEIFISNYNAEPNESNYYNSPLEMMKLRLDRYKDQINILEPEKRSETIFFSLKITATIRGSIKTGRKPYIQYQNVKYSNEILARSPGLIGKKLVLIVNIDDIRLVDAFLPNGSSIGKLQAFGKWGITPHSLRLRKEIYRLKIKKLIHFLSTDDPVLAYLNYLETNVGKVRHAANKIEELRRLIERNIEFVPNALNVSSEDTHDSNYKDIKETIKSENVIVIKDNLGKLLELNNKEVDDKHLKKFKQTIIF